MKTRIIIVLFVSFFLSSFKTRAQDFRYYDLVLDSLELPALAKDTTIDLWIEVDLWMDGTRRIFYKNIVRFTNKSKTVVIADRIYDVPRTQKFSCTVRIGSKFDIAQFDNYYLFYSDSIFATSRGRQYLFPETKAYRIEKKFEGESTALRIYWHLEVSKL